MACRNIATDIAKKHDDAIWVAIVDLDAPHGSAGQMPITHRVQVRVVIVLLEHLWFEEYWREIMWRVRILAEVVGKTIRVACVLDWLAVLVFANDELWVVRSIILVPGPDSAGLLRRSGKDPLSEY